MLRISVRPREFLVIPLRFGSHRERFIRLWRERKLRIGEIQMNESWIIIPFKQEIDLTKPDECNITAADSNRNYLKIDTSKLRAIHEVYSNKFRRIQKIGESKVKEKLYAKYSGRRKRKVHGLLHKLTKGLSDFAKGKTLIMERLKGVRKSVNRKVRMYNRFNRKIQSVSIWRRGLKRRLNT